MSKEADEARAMFELQLELAAAAKGQRSRISADEMLDAHALIEGWRGDFTDLLAPQP